MAELRGAQCREFKAVSSTGQDDVGPFYLNLDGRWHRFFLDAGLLFWKEGPEPDSDDDLLAGDRYIDLGAQLRVLGAAVDLVVMADNQFTMTFTNGGKLVCTTTVVQNETRIVALVPGAEVTARPK